MVYVRILPQDSANSLEAYPDYFVLAENIKFCAQLGVRGLYEEGPGVGSIKHGIPEGVSQIQFLAVIRPYVCIRIIRLASF